jgi:hypothetical protein
MSKTTTLAEVMSSLEAVTTWDAYESLKRRASRLSRPDQLRVVDAFIGAYRRLSASRIIFPASTCSWCAR